MVLDRGRIDLSHDTNHNLLSPSHIRARGSKVREIPYIDEYPRDRANGVFGTTCDNTQWNSYSSVKFPSTSPLILAIDFRAALCMQLDKSLLNMGAYVIGFFSQ